MMRRHRTEAPHATRGSLSVPSDAAVGSERPEPLAGMPSWLGSFDARRFIAAECLVLVVTLACFAPPQNDTWWALAAGRTMANDGHVMLTEQFSHTAYGARWANNGWLSQVIFYQTYHLGGMPLLTALCALLLVGACVLAWRLMRGPVEDRVLIFALAFPLVTPEWSLRPQVFTLVILMLVVHLVVRERFWLLPPVFCLWANLHSAVALGLVVLAGDFVAAVVARRGWRRRAVAGLLSLGATLVTPLGPSLWPEVYRSLQRSRINRITEWQPPTLTIGYAVFWLVVIGLLWLAVTRWQRVRRHEDRSLVAVSVLMMTLAVRSMRNMGPFGLVVAPALSRLVWFHEPAPQVTETRGGPVASLVRAFALAASVVLAVLIVRDRWTADPPPSDWTPVSSEAAAAIRECPGPIYNHYNDGGFLIWFVPEQKVFIDSRQDPYPIPLSQAEDEAVRTGSYSALFGEYGIRCAVVRPASSAVSALESDGWELTYRDSQWAVVKSPASAG